LVEADLARLALRPNEITPCVQAEMHRLRRRADGQVHQVLRVGDAVGVRSGIHARSMAGKQAHGTGLAACSHAVQQLPTGETSAGIGMGGV
jgi:hypothetical protein